MKIDKANAPYVKTKPIHSSQTILKEDAEGMIFSIQVVLNFELGREIMGFGEQIQVLAPKRLVGTIQSRFKNALKNYQQMNDIV